MKPKIFKDKLWTVFLIIEILIMLLLSMVVFFAIFVLNIAIKDPSQDYTALIIFELIWAGLGIPFCLLLFNSPRVLDRAFGRLLVYEDRIVYKCPFRITRKMAVENCKYVGVEDYKALNSGIPMVRGDEVSFIYVSNIPYPKNYKNKISLLKNKSGFIKFSYSDELARSLLQILPPQRVYFLNAFYNQIQARERALKKK